VNPPTLHPADDPRQPQDREHPRRRREGQSRPLLRSGWLAAVLVVPAISAGVVFGLAGEIPEDRWVGQLEERPEGFVDAGDPVALSPRFGGPGDAETLVLYDSTGNYKAEAETYGIAAANLATHFGQVEARKVLDYTADLMDDFDAVIYVGSQYDEPLPQAFLDDVLEGGTPVIWAGLNVWRLADEDYGGDQEQFVETYGWRADHSNFTEEIEVRGVEYKEQLLDRDPRNTNGLLLPDIVDDEQVEILASAVCGPDPLDPQNCTGPGWESETSMPWAIRSANLTYVGEVPFTYVAEGDRYLIFADLLYHPLAPDTEPVRQAAVRLEDVGPMADPEDLIRMADYLSAEGVPFQVAVVPIHIEPPDANREGWLGISLADRPKIVDALKYMQERGGTLIQHGSTHQYDTLDNPYNGASGGDFEFIRAQCTANDEEPYEIEPCQQDSFVQLTGPVEQDEVADHRRRLEKGRAIFEEVGLELPTIFETPHYAATPNAYAAMAEIYETRYERAEYYTGLLSGDFDSGYQFGQYFPYRVHDIYGTPVLPENVGNVSKKEQNHHPARPPQQLVDWAEANLVVTESTASFFFHPFLPTEDLDAVVTGIKELGYTFVPAEELR
jgi:uncharacterized protein YdaL